MYQKIQSQIISLRVSKFYNLIDSSPKDGEIIAAVKKNLKEESKHWSRKGSKDSLGIQKANSDQVEDQDGIQTIYYKQTIESFKDDKHSVKIDEKEIQYSLRIRENTDREESKSSKFKYELNVLFNKEKSTKLESVSDKTPGVFSSKPKEASSKDIRSQLSESSKPSKKQENSEKSKLWFHSSVFIGEADQEYANEDDKKSNRSVAISVMKSEKSRRSIAISIMKDEPPQSRKSVAVSIMSEEDRQDELEENDVHDDVRSRMSIALSVNPDKILNEHNRIIEEEKQKLILEEEKQRQIQEEKNKVIEEENERQLLNLSKKSIALSAYPEKSFNERSSKSVAISVNPEKANVEESKKSIGLSWNPNNPSVNLSRKSIALSAYKNAPIEENKYSPESVKIRSISSDNDFNKSRIRSRKSVALSVSSNEDHLKERNQIAINEYEVNENYQITFKPFKAKRSIGLSVITHTPTQKSSKHSVGLSAISHTPTEKFENQSVALSALHLSQQNRDENASYKSAALSALRVIESKVPGVHPEISSKEETKHAPSSKRISKTSNSKQIMQPSNIESSKRLSTKKSSKHDYSCQVVHGRDKEESHSSLLIDRDVALDPYKRDQSVDAYKRNNATQFRISQKTESQETNNLNKQLQVSDDLTIEINYQKEKSVKVTPNIG